MGGGQEGGGIGRCFLPRGSPPAEHPGEERRGRLPPGAQLGFWMPFPEEHLAGAQAAEVHHGADRILGPGDPGEQARSICLKVVR